MRFTEEVISDNTCQFLRGTTCFGLTSCRFGHKFHGNINKITDKMAEKHSLSQTEFLVSAHNVVHTFYLNLQSIKSNEISHISLVVTPVDR